MDAESNAPIATLQQYTAVAQAELPAATTCSTRIRTWGSTSTV